MTTLNQIQQKLKAPKGQTNNFGKYNYRSCEDILQAVKPHMGEGVITLDDELVQIGERIYVKATATFRCGEEQVSTNGYAREPGLKKGMDEMQITGAASSYARKYALAGLLMIDGEKDADAYNTHGKENPPPQKEQAPKQNPPPQRKRPQQNQQFEREYTPETIYDNGQATNKMRMLISQLTKGGTNKDAVAKLCKGMNIKGLEEVPSIDLDKKVECISYLESLTKGQK